jgi:hypothetical protein
MPPGALVMKRITSAMNALVLAPKPNLLSISAIKESNSAISIRLLEKHADRGLGLALHLRLRCYLMIESL